MINFKISMEWNGDGAVDAMTRAANRGLTAAAAVGADAAVATLTRNGDGAGAVIGYVSGGRFKEGAANGAKASGRKVFSASKAGGALSSRSGHLANSIAFVSPEDMGTPLKAAYGTNVLYAKIHEFGGVITAKGKKLAVPVHPAAQGKSPKDFPNLRFIKTKTQALLVRDVGGRNGRAEIMFVLKDRVFMPARPWLLPSSRKAEPAMAAAFKAVTAKAFGAELGGTT